MKAIADGTGFTGYYRRGSRDQWKAVVHACTEQRCLDLLLTTIPAGDKCVLADDEGEPPQPLGFRELCSQPGSERSAA